MFQSADKVSVTNSDTKSDARTESDSRTEEKAKLKKFGDKFARECLVRSPRGLSMATIQQHFIRDMHSNGHECVEGARGAGCGRGQRALTRICSCEQVQAEPSDHDEAKLNI